MPLVSYVLNQHSRLHAACPCLRKHAMAKILVVDDDDLNRRLACILLAEAGHETIEAGGGEEAVDLAIAEKPDLVLMDLLMPKVDGIEAARRLRRRPATRDIPIVTVTAYPEKWDKASACREAGFLGCISKPISIASFADEVQQYIDRSRQGSGQASPGP